LQQANGPTLYAIGLFRKRAARKGARPAAPGLKHGRGGIFSGFAWIKWD